MSKFLLHAILRGFDTSRENQYFNEPILICNGPIKLTDEAYTAGKIIETQADSEVSFINWAAPTEDCPSSLSVIEDYLKSR